MSWLVAIAGVAGLPPDGLIHKLALGDIAAAGRFAARARQNKE